MSDSEDNDNNSIASDNSSTFSDTDKNISKIDKDDDQPTELDDIIDDDAFDAPDDLNIENPELDPFDMPKSSIINEPSNTPIVKELGITLNNNTDLDTDDDQIDTDEEDSEEDEDTEEEDEDYNKKFSKDVVSDYIDLFHPESSTHNFDEVSALSMIKRDKNNNIIDNFHKTIPFMTKFEKAKILGLRATQLAEGAQPFIKVSDNIISSYLIAKMELDEKKIPFIIRRPIPNGGSEYWKVKDLEIIV